MGTYVDILKLIRVANCVLAFAGVLLGAHMTRQWEWYYPPIIAGIAALFVCAAGNIVNDILDIRIDRINRPERVLVRQTLSMRFAWGMAIVCTVIALVLAASVNTKVLVSAVVTIVLLGAYNFGLKKIPLLGNGIIALLGAMTFLTGAWAIDAPVFVHPPGALAPAVFAFLLHLIREIVKDVEDLDGDRRANVKTLPQLIGVDKALRLVFVLFLILAGFIAGPVIFQWYRPIYGWITIFGIILPLLIVMIAILQRPDRDRIRNGSLGLKIGMGLGLIALMLA